MTEIELARAKQSGDDYATLCKIVDSLPENEWDAAIAKALPHLDKLSIQLSLQAHFATFDDSNF